MTVLNATEILVRDIFKEEYPKTRLVCDCDKCKEDILAMTLNRVPPRYVATEKGELYVKAQFMGQQLRSDILRELTISAEVVGKNSRHLSR